MTFETTTRQTSLFHDRTELNDGVLAGWVADLYELGRTDRYGYRMPGTSSDHKAAHYIAARLRDLGVKDVRLEPVPIAVAFPDVWSLQVGIDTFKCGFIRYAGYTASEGVTAPLCYVGAGGEADFASRDVRGKIVLVDLLAEERFLSMGDVYYTHDTDDALSVERNSVLWPLRNLASSYELAFRNGAAGWIGVLTPFGDDTHEYLHWYAKFEMPALTVSEHAGVALRKLAHAGARATLTLTGSKGQGVAYNVYGFIPGAKASEQQIVLKTHYDGWATNEASGVAVTLAAAALLLRRSETLDRTVMVFFRASHFGVSWSLGPESWHVSAEEAASIYGLNQQWRKYRCEAWERLDRTLVVNNVEMIGRRHARIGNEWIALDAPAPRHWGVTGPEKGANPLLLDAVCSAIRSYDIGASEVSNFLIGDGWEFARFGVPLVNCISHNVWQFTSRDTPATVYTPDLLKMARAFVDIVRAEDSMEWSALRPAAQVPFAYLPGGSRRDA